MCVLREIHARRSVQSRSICSRRTEKAHSHVRELRHATEADLRHFQNMTILYRHECAKDRTLPPDIRARIQRSWIPMRRATSRGIAGKCDALEVIYFVRPAYARGQTDTAHTQEQ